MSSVDDVWREIEKQPKKEMMTLEDFLFKAEEGLSERKGSGRAKRSLSLSEKAAEMKEIRMIKNRESAARSRERKQAYEAELESMVVRLEEEYDVLLKDKAEQEKKRLKQLMQSVIPVTEMPRPPRILRKIASM